MTTKLNKFDKWCLEKEQVEVTEEIEKIDKDFSAHVLSVPKTSNQKPECMVYNASEIAAMLGCAKSSIPKILKENNIPTIPGIKNIIVKKAIFDKWITSE